MESPLVHTQVLIQVYPSRRPTAIGDSNARDLHNYVHVGSPLSELKSEGSPVMLTALKIQPESLLNQFFCIPYLSPA